MVKIELWRNFKRIFGNIVDSELVILQMVILKKVIPNIIHKGLPSFYSYQQFQFHLIMSCVWKTTRMKTDC